MARLQVVLRDQSEGTPALVEADQAGVKDLRLALPELRNGSERIAYAAPDADPTNTLGRPIEIFTVNYMHVTQPTKARWIYKLGTPSAPKDPAGWKPVQLVPENARPGHGGFPLEVAPKTNQAIWLEVYTGRNRRAGVYKGVATVRGDGLPSRFRSNSNCSVFRCPILIRCTR